MMMHTNNHREPAWSYTNRNQPQQQITVSLSKNKYSSPHPKHTSPLPLEYYELNDDRWRWRHTHGGIREMHVTLVLRWFVSRAKEIVNVICVGGHRCCAAGKKRSYRSVSNAFFTHFKHFTRQMYTFINTRRAEAIWTRATQNIKTAHSTNTTMTNINKLMK